MSNAVTNSKIERVVEAFEGMAIAVSVSVKGGKDPLMAFDAVKNARDETRDALVDFLKPALRVVGEAP